MRNEFYSAFDWERPEPAPAKADDFRSPFQIDRDRIIHNSAFRRLQSKTQVFMSGEYDFYRTRLTHSIEVAQIGRSICSRLRAVSDALEPECFIDPDLVEAACLAHDIGHPPFGHTGERTLHRLMKSYGGFEGNAQTLRMITRTIFSGRTGMNPTRALMDGVLKYKTLYAELNDPPNHFLYQSQKADLNFVLDGQPFPPALAPGPARDDARSIECQIMDWADDTAYSLNDVADGIKAGFVTIENMERWAEKHDLDSAAAGHVAGLCEAIRGQRVEAKMNKRIGFFIAAAQLRQTAGFLSDRTVRHRYRLEIDPTIAGECAIYKKLAHELVFSSQKLQQLDKKADFIVTRLFGALADLYVARDRPGPDHFRLLPETLEERIFSAENDSARARLICDAIAGMTDIVAARTYKRLFDADFGSIMDLVSL